MSRLVDETAQRGGGGVVDHFRGFARFERRTTSPSQCGHLHSFAPRHPFSPEGDMSVVDPVPPRRKLSVPQSRYQSRSPDHLRPPVPPTHAVPRPPPLGPAKDGEARPRRHSRSKSPDSPRSVASPGTAILNHSAILKEFQEEIGDVAVNPEGHFNKFFKVC